MNQAISQELVDEIDLGSARGKRVGRTWGGAEPLQVEVIRGLTAEDLPAIQSPPPVAAPQQVVKSIRTSHHRLAQLVAEGKKAVEISLATGYSQSYISSIQNDPAFEELVSFYASQRVTIFADAQERIKSLGLDATERLQELLHDETATWTKKDLMDLVELTGINERPGQKAGQGYAAGGSVAPGVLEIRFVGVDPGKGSGPVVDASFKDVTPGGGQ